MKNYLILPTRIIATILLNLLVTNLTTAQRVFVRVYSDKDTSFYKKIDGGDRLYHADRTGLADDTSATQTVICANNESIVSRCLKDGNMAIIDSKHASLGQRACEDTAKKNRIGFWSLPNQDILSIISSPNVVTSLTNKFRKTRLHDQPLADVELTDKVINVNEKCSVYQQTEQVRNNNNNKIASQYPEKLSIGKIINYSPARQKEGNQKIANPIPIGSSDPNKGSKNGRNNNETKDDQGNSRNIDHDTLDDRLNRLTNNEIAFLCCLAGIMAAFIICVLTPWLNYQFLKRHLLK